MHGVSAAVLSSAVPRCVIQCVDQIAAESTRSGSMRWLRGVWHQGRTGVEDGEALLDAEFRGEGIEDGAHAVALDCVWRVLCELWLVKLDSL